MDEKDLRSIIEQVLTEMNVSGAKPAEKAAAACACESAPEVEDGCIPDITEIDIRKQYLVKNPENGEEYAELKMNAPCRLGIGKAGARYNTLPQLEFRAAHSAAQDAVFNDVDAEFVEKMGLWTVQTQCDSKDTYLTRPDLGRKLSPEAVETIKAKCKKNPTVQIYVADGLSSAAVAANIGDLLPAILQGLESYKIDVGTPFFVKYGRVGVMDEISELTGATVTCTLIGERPGLITAESMSAYIAYKATVGMPEARRTVVSNIHRAGTIRRGRRPHRGNHQDHAGQEGQRYRSETVRAGRKINMKRDPLPAHVLATRIIPNVAPDMAKELGLTPDQKSLAIVTADSDDVTYTALDEATKKADCKVVYAKSFYAGAANANTKLAGEIIGILAAPNPAEAKAGLEACVDMIENVCHFVSANDDDSICYYAHCISRTGSYLSEGCGIAEGEAIAYLIAPPLEAMYGVDAALKAADVRMCVLYAPPSETNFGGALLTGSQSACKSACDAFAAAVESVADQPKV